SDWKLELGKTYIKGGWDSGTTGLRNLLALLRATFSVKQIKGWLRAAQILPQEWNRISRSYANVAHHYDVPEPVFRRFLDSEMFYSCAYFPQENMSLEQAQQAKARHIAGKLLVQPGDRILDIGCGWGSMAFHLAREYQ